MLLDLLKSDGYIQFNIILAQILGLEGAVYCSELFNIFSKASKKNKLYDNIYFKIDRKYIFMRTTISIESQLKLDKALISLGLLQKSADNPDIVTIDVNTLVSLMTSEDAKSIQEISNKVSKIIHKDEKETKKTKILEALKDAVICQDYKLETALRDWVESIYVGKNGYITKKTVEIFQDTLFQYTKDLSAALKIVEIATIQGYKDCQWAINTYEKDLKLKKQMSNNAPRVTAQNVGVSLSDKIF